MPPRLTWIAPGPLHTTATPRVPEAIRGSTVTFADPRLPAVLYRTCWWSGMDSVCAGSVSTAGAEADGWGEPVDGPVTDVVGAGLPAASPRRRRPRCRPGSSYLHLRHRAARARGSRQLSGTRWSRPRPGTVRTASSRSRSSRCWPRRRPRGRPCLTTTPTSFRCGAIPEQTFCRSLAHRSSWGRAGSRRSGSWRASASSNARHPFSRTKTVSCSVMGMSQTMTTSLPFSMVTEKKSSSK